MSWVAVLDVLYLVVVWLLNFSSVRMNTYLMLVNILVYLCSVQGGAWKNRIFIPILFGIAAAVFVIMVFETTDFKVRLYQITFEICVLENKIRYGKDIKSVASMGTDKDPEILRLKIRMNESAELYLKGFCGTVYYEGRWKEADRLKEERVLENYLKEHAFYPASQLSETLRNTALAEEIKETEVTVENLGATRKYHYIPNLLFASDESSIAEAEGIKNNRETPGIFGSKAYTYTTYYVEDMAAFTENILNYDFQSESEYEELYRSYVYDTCLSVPENLQQEIPDTDLSRIGGETAEDVVKSVVRSTEEMEDHFERVSTAVLLFRYAGMPARYVEGYYVNGKEASDEIQITDKNLTAWAEVYLDRVGFVPVLLETNPGKTGETDTLSGETAYAQEEAKSGMSVLKGASEDQQQSGNGLFRYVLLCLCAAVLTEMLLLFFPGQKKRRKQEAEIFCEFHTDFSVYLCIVLKNMLEYQGIYVDFRFPYTYCDEVKEKLGRKERDRFEKVLHLSDEIRFGCRKGIEEYGKTESGKANRPRRKCPAALRPDGRVRSVKGKRAGRTGKNRGRRNLYRF